MKTNAWGSVRVFCGLILFGATLQAHAETYTLKSKVFAGTFDGFADRLTITAGDLDGDGDVDIIGGYAQGGLVYLRNPETHLPVSPPSITVLPGEGVAFTVPGYAGTSIWSFVANNSSGTLDSVSGLYAAGPHSGVIDLIQASDGAGLYGRACVNVISPADVSAAGKAIILAGRRNPADPLWPTTDYLAGQSFLTLRYRGFARENIQYLSPVTGRDVDGNGLADDIDGLSTLAAAGAAVTNWAAGADRLFIHLVDHGGDISGAGYFRLSENEVLTAAELDTWLDALQDRYGTEVTLLIDCCYAGSFLDELSYTGTARRVVIAACGTNEPTYFVAGGLVSFSDAFLSGTLLGLDVAQSFGLASNAMSAYQVAGMTDTDTGAPLAIGSTFVAGRDIPQIGKIAPEQTLSGGLTDADLWAEQVVSVYPVHRVWALIVPPGHNPNPDDPVADLPQLELGMSGGAGRYEGTYSGFTQRGLYKVMIYAQDIWDSISLPRQTYVNQTGFDERAVLVAGGETNDPGWTAVNNMAGMAWHTCRQRWFAPGSIRYLNACMDQDVDEDGTNDIAALPTLANLGDAITNWAAASDKLTVYLIGAGSNGTLRLNSSEQLTAAMLDGWLDAYQASNRQVSVILDCADSGAFLPVLIPPAGRERIAIASTKAGGPSVAANGGLVSFSQYFWSDIFSGYDIGHAFARAKEAIASASGRVHQTAQLDDNADGVYSKADGAVANGGYLGSAFVTGAEAPAIGSVMPPAVLNGTNASVLWVAGVTAMQGISNVWCFVTPPEYDGRNELPRVDLGWNAGTERYEGTYSNFTGGGTYVLTFQAQDTGGEISSPMQSEVLTADAYEPDDTAGQASPFEVGGAQEHNRHASNDEDWVMFYAPAHTAFAIEAEQLGSNSDLALEVYTAAPDGTLTNLWWLNVDDCGPGEETEVTAVDLAADPELTPGLYYVRVTTAEPELWGAGSEYELRIWVTEGDESMIVVTFDKLNQTKPPPGAVAIVDGVTTQAFGTNTSLTLTLTNGVHTVRVPAVPGYLPEEDPTQPGQVNNGASLWYGNPKQIAVTSAQTPGMAIFQFVPVVRAQGVVRDGLTGAWLPDAALQFRAASGCISGVFYTAWPTTNYATPWVTRADGSFPTNVWLPTVNWDLTLVKPDYSNQAIAGVLGAAAPNTATATNLGTFWLAPLDTNGNGVADGWERQYFPAGGFAATNDADGDHIDNYREYLLGTDPTNALSVLAVELPPEALTNGFTLRWPVMPGRTYDLLSSAVLASDLWTCAAGPWTATNGQAEMQWTETNTAGVTTRFFRVNLVVP